MRVFTESLSMGPRKSDSTSIMIPNVELVCVAVKTRNEGISFVALASIYIKYFLIIMKSVTNNVAKVLVKNIKLNNNLTINVGFILLVTILLVCFNIWARHRTIRAIAARKADKKQKSS